MARATHGCAASLNKRLYLATDSYPSTIVTGAPSPPCAPPQSAGCPMPWGHPTFGPLGNPSTPSARLALVGNHQPHEPGVSMLGRPSSATCTLLSYRSSQLHQLTGQDARSVTLPSWGTWTGSALRFTLGLEGLSHRHWAPVPAPPRSHGASATLALPRGDPGPSASESFVVLSLELTPWRNRFALS